MNLLDFLGFMFFSAIEGLSIYAIIFYSFRFNFKKYFLHALVMVLLVGMQSYFIREETSLAFLSTTISFASTGLFLVTIVNIPVIWSLFMCVVGFAGSTLLQTVIMLLSFGWLTIDQVQHDPIKGYILQILSAVISLYLTHSLYNRGYGFSFEFEKMRFKLENVFVIIFILGFIVALIFLMYYQDLYINLIFFFFALLIYLYYSTRKESNGG